MKRQAQKVKQLTSDELRARVVRFYARYGMELEQIKELLAIQLRQIALAYTLESKLPREAVTVTARVKSLDSFLKKLERDAWPQFYYPTEVVHDLIGARVVCWFVDDCYGMLKFVQESQHFKNSQTARLQVKDYIQAPQFAGYRALHVFREITYDRVRREPAGVAVRPEGIICEVQIRTRLQDAWADITHEFFYKAKDHGVEQRDYESFLADISERLATEDKTFMKFRNVYQQLADSKTKKGKREGFRDEFEG